MQAFRPTRFRGFSLVELMIAMLIGLIGMIIIFQVFEVSEGIKRSTTSGGDAQQNGAVALYVMEHDLRNAGMGFNDMRSAGCNIVGNDTARATPAFSLLLTPVLICAPGTTNPGGKCPGTGIPGTSPDQLTAFYGSQTQVAGTTLITTAVAAPDVNLSVKNAFGYAAGDLFVVAEPASGKNCSLWEATQIGDLTGSNIIYHEAGKQYAGKTARFNSGPLLVPYAIDNTAANNTARLFNLGNLYQFASGTPAPGGIVGANITSAVGRAQAAIVPIHNTYAIDAGNTLTVASAFVIDPATRAPLVSAVADNIVQIRAQYGLDDGNNDGSVPFNTAAGVAGDGLVDRFVSAATFNALVPLPWRSVMAVRVAIVARSALAEKPRGSDGANCDATTDGTEATPGPDQRPRWAGGIIDVSASGDPAPASPLYWKCYRYRVFETVVPLRNWIWKTS